MYLNNKLVFLAGSTGLAGSSIMSYILNNYPTTKIRAAYYKHTQPFIEHERIDYVYGELKSKEDCERMVKSCDCAIMAAANTTGSGTSARTTPTAVFPDFPWWAARSIRRARC